MLSRPLPPKAISLPALTPSARHHYPTPWRTLPVQPPFQHGDLLFVVGVVSPESAELLRGVVRPLRPVRAEREHSLTATKDTTLHNALQHTS